MEKGGEARGAAGRAVAPARANEPRFTLACVDTETTPPQAESVLAHPVRVVVSDDLRRSRLTVFFRVLLAIPHLIWAALFSVIPLLAAFVGWWVTLFTGRMPDGLHKLLAGFVRYLAHVEAYVLLAANPFPSFYYGGENAAYPVDVEIDPPTRQRGLVTLFRLFLALPALLISIALTGGGGYGGGYRAGAGAAGLAAVLIWFAALARGRAPRGLRNLTVWGIGYSAQVAAYLFLLTDRYPNSNPRLHVQDDDEPGPSQPARGIVADDRRRSRLTVLFRFPLWFPHFIWLMIWTVAAIMTAFLGWFAALALGRLPEPFNRFLAAYARYSVHNLAFLHLIGNPFPGFVGRSGSYPIDLEIDTGRPQRRVTILFRFFLGLPALLLAGAGSNVAVVASILGWFVSLVRGEMPEGLRNAGAWALSYSGQAWAYLFLLSDRYPFSSPAALLWEPPGATLSPPPGAFV
jgi:hypothetical protein